MTRLSMNQVAGVIIFSIVVIGIIISVIRARKMNKEQSALTMHPDNFKKAEIEQVETKNESEKSPGHTSTIIPPAKRRR